MNYFSFSVNEICLWFGGVIEKLLFNMILLAHYMEYLRYGELSRIDSL